MAISPPLLFVIVLSSDRPDDTYDCLTSLMQNNYPNFKILCLEYSLKSGSVQALQKEFPQIQVIQLAKNLGYAGNNNIGIQEALMQGAEWILLLNNDTILDTGFLAALVGAGEPDPTVGIVGPMVYHFNEPDVIQSAGGTLDYYWHSTHMGMNETDHGQYSAVRQVDWVSGCAIMVRRDLVEQVGALDPDYFLYWEETEWCIRANRAGWKVIHVPHARLWHKGVNREYDPKPYVTYYMTRNYLLTLTKHKAHLLIRLLALGNVLKTLLSWSVKPRWRSRRDHRNAMWRGLVDFLNNRFGPIPS